MNQSIFAALLIGLSTSAVAAPGVGDPIYAARIENGITEVEARYGRLTGGPENGQDGLVVEVEHAFSSNFSAATLFETNRDPGGGRRLNAVAIEGVYGLGKIKAPNLDTALYVELKGGVHGDPDAIETKALLQHSAGKFDSRLNLIAEKPLRSGEPVEFGYAASMDWAVADELRLGLAAFGDLGTSDRFGGRQSHFVGPEAKFDIEHVGPGEIEVETGWLKAFGAANDRTNGQARLLVGYELHL